MSWKEENERDYSHKLWQMDFLGEEGLWSVKMHDESVGADMKKYLLLQAGPSIAMIVFFVLVSQFIAKALSEEGPDAGGKRQG